MGQVYVPSAGTVLFQTESDDDSRLYIDGRLVVDNAGPRNDQMNAATGQLGLTAGWHDLRLVLLVQDNGGGIILRYALPGNRR